MRTHALDLRARPNCARLERVCAQPRAALEDTGRVAVAAADDLLVAIAYARVRGDALAGGSRLGIGRAHRAALQLDAVARLSDAVEFCPRINCAFRVPVDAMMKCAVRAVAHGRVAEVVTTPGAAPASTAINTPPRTMSRRYGFCTPDSSTL